MTTTLAAVTARPVPQRPNCQEIVARLYLATGQLARTAGMLDERGNCPEVVEQLAAVRAAVDAVALSLLSTYAESCVQVAVEHGQVLAPNDELVTVVRQQMCEQWLRRTRPGPMI